MMRSVFGGPATCVVCVMVLVALVQTSQGGVVVPAPAQGGPDAAISVRPSDGRYVDGLGRSRMFHGVNVVHRHGPFPAHWVTDQAMADLANSAGVRAVRITVEWALVEPVRSRYNDTYIEEILSLQRRFAAHGIFSLLDMHQDVHSPYFCFNGAPTWSVRVRAGAAGYPIPAGPDACPRLPSGAVDCANCGGPSGFWSTAYFSEEVSSAVQSLYDNVDGTADAFAAAFAHTATFFKNEPFLLGYEIMNKPWAGDIYSDPLLLVRPAKANTKHLMPFYRRVHAALRRVDDVHVLFYEPVTGSTQVVPLPSGFTEGPGGHEYDNRQAFAYHHYCPLVDLAKPHAKVFCHQVYGEAAFAIHEADARTLGGGSFITEMGYVGDNPTGIEDLRYVLALADRYQSSWMYWSLEDIGSKVNITREIARPYPLAVMAGAEVTMFGFDVDTVVFTMKLKITAAPLGAPRAAVESDSRCTEVFASSVYWYSGGATVEVTPAGALDHSYDATAGVVRLCAAAATAGDVTVVVGQARA